MSRKPHPVEEAWINALRGAGDDLLRRGEFHHAKVANAIADAMEKGERVDLDTFRQPQETGRG